MTDTTIIGQNIDKIRIARGFTKTQLAKALAPTQETTVSKHIRTGQMSTDQLIKYASILSVEPYELVVNTLVESKYEVPLDITGLYPWSLAYVVEWYILRSEYPRSKTFTEEESEQIKEQALNNLYMVYIPWFINILNSEYFSNRERNLITMRYKHCMILEDCAKAFNVTRERVRQIEKRIIRKLSNPKFQNVYHLITSERLQLAEKQLFQTSQKLREYEAKYGDLNGDKEPEPIEETPRRIRLEELNLSVRTFNCLRRKGYYFLDELCGISIEELMKIRNLGRRSLEELLNKLKEYGIEIETNENEHFLQFV